MNGNKSDYFMSYTGVRQGENLSPLLFSLYINDLENFLVHKNVNPVAVTDEITGTYLKIFLLLYADDTIIIANNAESLQTSLTHLSEYCQKWKLTINIDKTKIMVFSKTQWKGNFILQYEGKDLENVQELKYLGVIFNYNGSFVKNRKHVYEQAQRAMFSLLRRSRQLDLPLDIQLELFDKLIMPILTYGCEVWGFENLNIIEKLHLKYLIYILGVKMSTPTCMVLGETGRFPVNITIKTHFGQN